MASETSPISGSDDSQPETATSTAPGEPSPGPTSQLQEFGEEISSQFNDVDGHRERIGANFMAMIKEQQTFLEKQQIMAEQQQKQLDIQAARIAELEARIPGKEPAVSTCQVILSEISLVAIALLTLYYAICGIQLADRAIGLAEEANRLSKEAYKLAVEALDVQKTWSKTTYDGFMLALQMPSPAIPAVLYPHHSAAATYAGQTCLHVELTAVSPVTNMHLAILDSNGNPSKLPNGLGNWPHNSYYSYSAGTNVGNCWVPVSAVLAALNPPSDSLCNQDIIFMYTKVSFACPGICMHSCCCPPPPPPPQYHWCDIGTAFGHKPGTSNFNGKPVSPALAATTCKRWGRYDLTALRKSKSKIDWRKAVCPLFLAHIC
ncbi:hypothetical protein B0T26DRAFT_757213 [Lasiosphaeria miniovina]|uniref:Uncharacterized protein n=1 Tax=Lasiosphaeria miniovina TaxID=1954250 RepID=A0AA39ZTZ2_9PEZI|nr:uncharacterized protein B0T26DRAFT_757213 [Lasiosphaeria miniovina]KAK0703694.1 hypothetical protein B0T26DRAFT_757213 [Lasiosphaeria miniovina]